MSSQPIDHQHPVVDFGDRLIARLHSLADVPLLSMTPDDKRRCPGDDRPGQRPSSTRSPCGCSPTPRTPRPPSSPVPPPPRTGWPSRPGRYAATPAPTSSSPSPSSSTTCSRPGWPPGRSTSPRPAPSSRRWTGCRRTGEFAVTAEQRREAEAHLVAFAAEYDAQALRILGRRILEVIAPDLAERFEGKALEAEEAKAARRTTFTMWEDDEGTTHGRFRIPARHGQMLRKMILALTSPRRSGIDPDLPTPVRDGIAFTQLIESITATRAAQDRWLRRHRRGHHDPRAAPRPTSTPPGCAPWTPAAASPPPKPADSPAAPASSRWCSAASPRSSTSARSAASTPNPCASPWESETEAAPPKAATSHPVSATPTTTSPTARAAAPASTTADCSAPTTTAASTTRSYQTVHLPNGKVSFHRRT